MGKTFQENEMEMVNEKTFAQVACAPKNYGDTHLRFPVNLQTTCDLKTSNLISDQFNMQHHKCSEVVTKIDRDPVE